MFDEHVHSKFLQVFASFCHSSHAQNQNGGALMISRPR